MTLTNSSPINVLVVDDDQVCRCFAQSVYRDLGCDTWVADTGTAAFDIVSRIPIDLVLLDIHIPETNSLLLLKQMQESASAGSTPVFVVISGDDCSERQRSYINAGCTYILLKPASSFQLQQCLKLVTGEAPHGALKNDAVSFGVFAADHTARQSGTMAGDRKFIKNFLQSFREELNRTCPQIDNHIVDHEFCSAAELVHKMNAAAGYCGELQLQQCCRKLEAALRAVNINAITRHYAVFLLQCADLGYKF